MQTADWQFLFSDRFTGARNPARLPTKNAIPSNPLRPPFITILADKPVVRRFSRGPTVGGLDGRWILEDACQHSPRVDHGGPGTGQTPPLPYHGGLAHGILRGHTGAPHPWRNGPPGVARPATDR